MPRSSKSGDYLMALLLIISKNLHERYASAWSDCFKSLQSEISKHVMQIGQLANCSVVHRQLAAELRPISVATDPSYAFVLMAMSDADPALEDTYETIKRACRNVGVRAERVDEIQFAGQITEKILGSIEVAGIIIADLTHERPNVHYEIGYAHGHRKKVILIAKSGTPLHFDLQGMRVLFFKNMVQLQQQLEKIVAAFREELIGVQLDAD